MKNEDIEQLMLPEHSFLQGGKYRIDRRIASGGFGNTYEVYNVLLEERMALKEFFMKGVSQRDADNTTVSVSNTLNKELFEAQKEKFKKEARRLRKMHNPHIIHVHDLFEENGTAYYAMDFVDGESLSTRLKRTNAPLSEEETLDILNQVLQALEEVHSLGIRHLDLKPGNIMVDRQGNVKLIDFGASKQMAASGVDTTTSSMCYTPGYAPSEQIEQNMELIGPWTDLYALGATLYHLLTKNQPPTLSELQDENAFVYPTVVSEKMQYLIQWMMTVKRQKRPQSVAEVKEFLAKPFHPTEETLSVDDEDTMLGEKPEPSQPTPEPILEPTPQSPPKSSPKSSPHSPSKKWIGIGLAAMAFIGWVLVWNTIKKPSQEEILQNLINNMVHVDGGTFMMGATSEQGSDAYEDEKPAHQVTLSSFSICKYEVTQEEWEAVMGKNPSEFKGAKLPVEIVSWDDCQEFIRRLNELTGKQFRLPTEAEWEYAARGGSKSRGYKYAGGNDLGSVAWYCNNSGGKTHEVGQKQPNELGLYDMGGNVWEWCQDWGGSYSSSSQTNPTGPSSGSDRVCRGGGWFYDERTCRVSSRFKNTPSISFHSLGFRLAQ